MLLEIRNLYYSYNFNIGFLRKNEKNFILKDINLKLNKGNSIAILGNNGAGKSTLLKLIAGTLIPDSGKIIKKGKFTSVLNLNSGLLKDLSVIDNIKINYMLRGLSRKKINQLIDPVLEFADLVTYRKEPVKTLSTGMLARLGFSIVTSVKSDLLLIDEILSVGDNHFKEKSAKRIKNLKAQGTSLLLISHSQKDLESFADYGCILSGGYLSKQYSLKEAISVYNSLK